MVKIRAVIVLTSCTIYPWNPVHRSWGSCEDRYAKPTFGQFGESLSTKVHWLHGLCQSAAWHVSPKEIMLLSCKFSFTSFVLRAVLLVNGTLGTVERKNCMCSWWFQAPDYNKTCWNIHPSKQASIQCAQKKRVSHFQPIYIQSHSAATPRLKKNTGTSWGVCSSVTSKKDVSPTYARRETCAAQTFLHETLTSR